jgi:hypothetical protein
MGGGGIYGELLKLAKPRKAYIMCCESGTSFRVTKFGMFGLIKSRSSAVAIATSYGLDDRMVAVRVPLGTRIFTSPYRPHRLWGPPSLLFSGYRGLFLRQ